MRWILLLSNLLLATPCANGLNRDQSLEVLRYRLDLAAQTAPYFHLTPTAAVIYLGGVAVKHLPVRTVAGLSQGRYSKVQTLEPVEPIRKIVVRADEAGFDPQEVSPEETVGIDDMPEQFLVGLEDGSLVHVTTGARGGVCYWMKETFLKLRLAWSYMGALLKDNLNASVIRLEMKDYWARRLFWSLQEGSGVIY